MCSNRLAAVETKPHRRTEHIAPHNRKAEKLEAQNYNPNERATDQKGAANEELQDGEDLAELSKVKRGLVLRPMCYSHLSREARCFQLKGIIWRTAALGAKQSVAYMAQSSYGLRSV